jgi:hypothetical protein
MTNLHFQRRLAIGQHFENELAEIFAVWGGSAMFVVAAPGMGDTPRFTAPHPTHEGGTGAYVAPDLLFTLPHQPRAAFLAQLKKKKPQIDPGKGEISFLLDEKELHRMNTASVYHKVFFVIYSPEMANVGGYGPWIYVDVDDLREERNPLIKRTILQKPTFILPLTLFKSIHELRNTAIEPANTNAPPTLKVV